MRPQDAIVGQHILNGQLRVLQKIGSGGMGAVYKAQVVATQKLVAIKILHAKLAARKDIVSRFGREARAMSQLCHPNTTRVFQYGELEGGGLYIVMELLEGRNLNQTIRTDGPFPIERALPILVQICGALEEAHRLGMVHRDLKPENIFLCQTRVARDVPKVLDFGLAKLGEQQLRPGSIMLTQEGMVFGTPEFMSPEQAQGMTLTAASDIYSLAVILYEALTGKLPCDAKTPGEYIQFQVAGTPIPLNARVPGRTFPNLLEQVLTIAMAKSPDDRFRTAEQFAQALTLVIEGRADLPPELLPKKKRMPSLREASDTQGGDSADAVQTLRATRRFPGNVFAFGLTSKQQLLVLVAVAAASVLIGVLLAGTLLSLRK